MQVEKSLLFPRDQLNSITSSRVFTIALHSAVADGRAAPSREGLNVKSSSRTKARKDWTSSVPCNDCA